MMEHLGIRFTRIAEDTLEGTMPVDARTRQSFSLLHGGASVVLAESLDSVAGYLCTEGEQRVVGMEINAKHLRAVTSGEVRGVCRALHVGCRNQVWHRYLRRHSASVLHVSPHYRGGNTLIRY